MPSSSPLPLLQMCNTKLKEPVSALPTWTAPKLSLSKPANGSHRDQHHAKGQLPLQASRFSKQAGSASSACLSRSFILDISNIITHNDMMENILKYLSFSIPIWLCACKTIRVDNNHRLYWSLLLLPNAHWPSERLLSQQAGVKPNARSLLQISFFSHQPDMQPQSNEWV